MSTINEGHIKGWYPKLAAALSPDALQDLARLLEEVKDDMRKEAKAIARREADR